MTPIEQFPTNPETEMKESKSERFFDPARDLATEDWDSMVKPLEDASQDLKDGYSVNMHSFVGLASSLNELEAPRKVQITENVLDAIRTWPTSDLPKQNPDREYVLRASEVRRLGVDIPVDKEATGMMRQRLDTYLTLQQGSDERLHKTLGITSWSEYVDAAARLKRLDPTFQPQLTNDQWTKIMNDLHFPRSYDDRFAAFAANVHDLDPGRDLGLTTQSKQQLQQNLSLLKERGGESLAEYARNLQRLAKAEGGN